MDLSNNRAAGEVLLLFALLGEVCTLYWQPFTLTAAGVPTCHGCAWPTSRRALHSTSFVAVAGVDTSLKPSRSHVRRRELPAHDWQWRPVEWVRVHVAPRHNMIRSRPRLGRVERRSCVHPRGPRRGVVGGGRIRRRGICRSRRCCGRYWRWCWWY